MQNFNLKTIIDDILLLVRNNNISESEDLSREQIAQWILAYKALFAKQQADSNKLSTNDDTSDDSLTDIKGPIELQDIASLDKNNIFTRRTKDKIPELLGDSDDNLLSVVDQSGAVIQQMNKQRRFYHWFRRYTHHELTYYYNNGYIYIQGNEDCNKLKYIWISGIWQDNSDDADEEDITVPAWMIPNIKQYIMKNELAFMLNRPSDDSNNATLASVKPNGLQDKEE